MSQDDITALVQRLHAGRDEEAASRLWILYYRRLRMVARRSLGKHPRRIADEDDVASSAMRSFFGEADNGRLETVRNREELWKLLLTITIRKANRHKERAAARKRGGGMVSGESGLTGGADNGPADLASIPDESVFGAMMLELRDLISHLPSGTLREIALQRLEGFTVQEIASSRDVAQSTIKRKLARIREIWNAEFEGE